MAKLSVLAAISLCSIVLASCERVKYRDCGSKNSKIEEVDITPCTTFPCILKRGTNVRVEVKFVSTETVSKAKTVIYGFTGGEDFPFTGVSEDACQDQGLTCPLKPGTTNTFKTVLPVHPFYPAVKVLVQWELHDQDDNVVFCFKSLVVIA